MIQSIVHTFYPELGKEEARKFGLLSLMMFLVMATYWCLRLLKNTIFIYVAFPENLGWLPKQGILFQPYAKMISPWFVLLMVLIYSKLIDLFKRHQLFYILCTVYSILFIAIAFILILDPSTVGRYVLATTGWLSYFTIESFGSLIIVLFWSFINSITDTSSAKKGFPFIVAIGQIGGLLGSVAIFFSHSWPLWAILVAASFLLFLVIPLIRYFIATTPENQLMGYNAKDKKNVGKKKEGFFKGFVSGIVLLFTRPYLLGILVVSTFYEAIAQIVEYQMNTAASKVYISEHAFRQFMGVYGMGLNALTILIALLGTRYLLKRYGVRISLLAYPISFGLILLSVYLLTSFALSSPDQLLWLLFSAMVLIKAIGYAVNNPTKEMMYIPTSKDAKFKTKGWIDTFGSRGAKAGGGAVNNFFKYNINDLMLFGTLFGLGLIIVWIFAAIYVGLKNTKLIREGKMVG